MNVRRYQTFVLPDLHLSSLPTGQVKDVVDALGKKIARGDYPSGERIPMEPELSASFEVSRTVVREAIKVLSGKGLVRTARRYGSRVCPFDEWNLLDPDVIGWHEPKSPMARRIYAESTQMRCIVEPEAAALAAANGSEDQFATILAAARRISPEPDGVEAMIAADFVFHATILDASGNIMLQQLRRLILALLKFSYLTGAVAVPDEKISRQKHVRVAEAIAQGDGPAARDGMRAMLNHKMLVADKISRVL
jgi:DNA-binding FadR family transcriptional regulator